MMDERTMAIVRALMGEGGLSKSFLGEKSADFSRSPTGGIPSAMPWLERMEWFHQRPDVPGLDPQRLAASRQGNYAAAALPRGGAIAGSPGGLQGLMAQFQSRGGRR